MTRELSPPGPPPRLTSRLGRSALCSRSGRPEFLAKPASGVVCCCALPRPHTRARAHSRALTFCTRLALGRAGCGTFPSTDQTPTGTLATLARLSLAVTGPSDTFGVGCPCETPAGAQPAPGWSKARAWTQSPSLSRLPRPLPSPGCTRGHSAHQVHLLHVRAASQPRLESPRAAGGPSSGVR